MDRVVATGAWSRFWRAWYRLIALAGRPTRAIAVGPGYGNLVALHVAGRHSGRDRVVVLGVLRVGGRQYLGHPSGDAAWTLNLRAAPSAVLEAARGESAAIRPVPLGPGAERDAVVRASFRQHPFPGNALYRLSGRHVARFGVFFRLDPAPARSPVAPEAGTLVTVAATTGDPA